MRDEYRFSCNEHWSLWGEVLEIVIYSCPTKISHTHTNSYVNPAMYVYPRFSDHYKVKLLDIIKKTRARSFRSLWGF
jgi:hypothetical protein